MTGRLPWAIVAKLVAPTLYATIGEVVRLREPKVVTRTPHKTYTGIAGITAYRMRVCNTGVIAVSAVDVVRCSVVRSSVEQAWRMHARSSRLLVIRLLAYV